MVEFRASDPKVWVRFPLPAPKKLNLFKIEFFIFLFILINNPLNIFY